MKYIRLFSRGLWQGFDRLSRYIERYFTWGSMILLFTMWMLLLLNTVSRWAGNLPTGWSLEIVGFMMAWSVFLMMAPVARLDHHIRVTFLPEKLLGEKRGLVYMRIIENLTGMAVFIFMSIHAYRWVSEAFIIGLRTESMNGWLYPVWAIRSGVLIGFVAIAFVYFVRMVKDIRELGAGMRQVEEYIGEQQCEKG